MTGNNMLTSDEIELISADWPAPANIRAFTTTRLGGVSQPPYESFNLATHVHDDPLAVQQNRERLAGALSLPSEPAWLEQVHSNRIVSISEYTEPVEADGGITQIPGEVCVVLTADCLPVLLCNRAGTQVAAVHAGWKGLADGIVENAVDMFTDKPDDVLVWLGPAIGPHAFEVGEEVRSAFMAHDQGCADAFVPTSEGKWLADLYRVTRQRLGMLGVGMVFGGGLCTYSDVRRFYSYRRDGVTGRMASLIWME
jgi:YfiH family protein